MRSSSWCVATTKRLWSISTSCPSNNRKRYPDTAHMSSHPTLRRRERAKLILAISALLLSGELAAQTFKCTDAAGKITYSGTQCSELGLKDAGEVQDRLNVNPAYKPPARAIQSPPPAPAAKAPNTE